MTSTSIKRGTEVDQASLHLGERYGHMKYLGKGAYGMVVAATDLYTGNSVAVKRVAPFDNQLMTRRTLREIKVLRRLKHENLVYLYDVISHDVLGDLKELYLVQELMDNDLHNVLKDLRDVQQCLPLDHIRFFLYQILRGLKYLHSANVMHRDLKPSNILVNISSNSDLKICDFGLARVCDMEKDHAGFLTEYVATRWYRGPEVMLTKKNYGFSLDVWSVGCILAEMFTGRPVFRGHNYLDQLAMIFDVIGSPRPEELEFINSDRVRSFVTSLPFKPPQPLSNTVPTAPHDAVDLITHLLKLHPDERYTIDQALAHPFLAQYHDPEDEPLSDYKFSFEEEDDDYPIPLLKEHIKVEIQEFHLSRLSLEEQTMSEQGVEF